MKFKLIVLTAILAILVSCAAYKELEPEPQIKFFENGYIELNDDGEFFELDKGDKYFMKFPKPLSNNNLLVLEIKPKSLITTYLTDRFDDGEGVIKKLPELSQGDALYSVYALDQAALNYFWVIESVQSDLLLECRYRYVAAWRYKFENSYAELLNKFEQNQVKKDIYQSLGTSIHSDQVAIDEELNNLKTKSKNLEQVKNSLQEIENILPENIKNSSDKAYVDYSDLRAKVLDEIEFQQNYEKTLTILKTEKEFRGNSSKFSSAIPDLLDFYKHDNPENVEQELSSLIAPQLFGIVSNFDKEIKNKKDSKPIALNAAGLEQIYEYAGKSKPEDLEQISKYISNFNGRAESLEEVSASLSELKSKVKSAKSWPSNSFYPTIQADLSKIKSKIPTTGNKSSFGKYYNLKSAQLLNSSITSLTNDINSLGKDYDKAAGLVREINQLKTRSAYRDIIKLLKNNSKLDFLKAQYSDVDQLSLKQQKDSIISALKKNDFAVVESGLRSLYNDNYFLNMKAANQFKGGLIKSTEDTVMNRIERLSRKRALEFIDQNYSKFSDVEAMYSNAAFTPVHNLNFTTGDPANLNMRKQQLNNTLTNLKNITFPEKSIEVLYKEFTANSSSNGVQRARAIVEHGKHYTGTNSQIKSSIGECDPTASKWITKAKTYRKVYALPYTSNPQGNNEYIFKFNIKIPSDARFPVFDINIKLPKEIAGSAHEKQWYDKITMNGNILKNEGRFSIVAPTAANDYECQITPVQMDKDADNILEVRFTHSSFKVFEVSAMAQKPIIKKN